MQEGVVGESGAVAQDKPTGTKCSNRSMEAYRPVFSGNYDRPTERQTDQPTHKQKDIMGHGEVTLPIIYVQTFQFFFSSPRFSYELVITAYLARIMNPFHPSIF